MNDRLRRLRRDGVISDLDLHFALSMARLSGEQDPDVLLAAAMASRQVGQGHVCLDLARLAGGQLRFDVAEGADEPTWPAIEPWTAQLRRSGLIRAAAGPARPLVLDDAGRLFLHRYHGHQQRLADAITGRVARRPRFDEVLLDEGLARLFPAGADPGPGRGQLDLSFEAPDLQRLAARRAVELPFCVISGGPGTGKTYTVVKILALLIEQALHGGSTPPRVHLLAPTGKAAARLGVSIREARAGLDCTDDVKRAIPEEGSTIHRALGVMRGVTTRFRHHENNPLATDVVLVDEASMVDIALMRRLFDAVPEDARIILLGDKNQLASVEAGAVLGDICRAELPSIVHLTHSYRFDDDSGIGRVAAAINDARADDVMDILRSSQVPDVALVEDTLERSLSPALRESAVEGYRAYRQAPTLNDKLAAFDGFRVLCAHRRGFHGVEVINERIAAALEEEKLLRTGPLHYDGRPVMVTQNDHQSKLYNGDVGLVLQDGGSLRAFFIGPDGALRALSTSRLPPHETVFAMSVHKSQGSEFDEVAVVLPAEPSAVLSRELLYTAVTRAKKKVTIYGSEAVVRAAIETAVERASGLRDALA